MKRTLLTIGLSVFALTGLLMVQDRGATAALPDDRVTAVEHAGDQPSARPQLCTSASDLDTSPVAKKCSFSSDCKYGKCGKGKCGACSFTSDCNGWGKCGGGQCGKCSFSSECKGFGTCSGGKCTKSPY